MTEAIQGRELVKLYKSFGLCIAFLGPTILDLQCQTNSTLSQITWVFFAQQFCLLIGSSIGGVFRKTLFSALAALFISALIISVIFAIIPLCHNVLVLAIAMAVSGRTLLFSYRLCTFSSGSAPWSMLRHSPIVEQNINQTDHEANEASTVHYAFWIMAIINLPVPIAVLFLMYREQLIPCCPGGTPRLLDKDELAMENQQEAEGPDSEQTEHDVGGHGNIFSCCQKDNMRGLPVSFFMIHILGGMVLFMTDGIVGAYAGFVYTYAVAPPMSLPNKTAGYLASIFWAAITAGRLLSIPLSYRFQPVRLLMFNLAGAIVTVLMLLIFYTSSVFLFVGTCLCGLFLSSIFPCMLAYTEDILDYQGCATSVLVTCAGMGEMVMQVLVGSIIQSKGSYSFLLCGMIIACIGFVLFIGLLFFQRMHRNNLTGTSKKSAMVEEPDTAEQNGTAKTEQTENKESS
ncbi:hypothetical protein OJAV_G00068570 [Oryzias javanicus]|uniref:Major facilitator superfamily domain-containing protein 4A n=1 Tax=Oryzias javanicus TaxID=123683 RepID=A0A3S2N0C8_ORYJA|nr:hypothetical protein OJAV_G00068570 [Oryzias javanicus]